MTRTIAIYGGSFDPPHVGHLLVAAHVLATQPIDVLWFVPTHTHMLGKPLTAFAHRFEMTRRLTAPLQRRTRVDNAEAMLAARPGFKGSLTVELIRYLRAECPQDTFRFVVGSDLVGQCPTWEGWDEIVATAPPIVVNRAGYVSAAAPHQLTLPDVSSSAVRAAFAAGEDVSQLVPYTVLEYIQAHGLYPSAKFNAYLAREQAYRSLCDDTIAPDQAEAVATELDGLWTDLTPYERRRLNERGYL